MGSKLKLWHVLGGLGGGTVALALALALPERLEARKRGDELAAIGALKTISTSSRPPARCASRS